MSLCAPGRRRARRRGVACLDRRSQTRLRCPRGRCGCRYGYGCGYGLATLARARSCVWRTAHGAFTLYRSLLAVFLFRRNPSMSESDRRPKSESESESGRRVPPSRSRRAQSMAFRDALALHPVCAPRGRLVFGLWALSTHRAARAAACTGAGDCRLPIQLPWSPKDWDRYWHWQRGLGLGLGPAGAANIDQYLSITSRLAS